MRCTFTGAGCIYKNQRKPGECLAGDEYDCLYQRIPNTDKSDCCALCGFLEGEHDDWCLRGSSPKVTIHYTEHHSCCGALYGTPHHTGCPQYKKAPTITQPLEEPPELSKTVVDLLKDALETQIKKEKEYGKGYHRHGPIMAALFPNGVTLKTAEDHSRFAIFELLVAKLNRYTMTFLDPDNKQPDTPHDTGIYAFMLEELERLR